MDWKNLEFLAIDHGVAPLLHYNFVNHNADDIPEHARGFFKDAYYQSLATNTLIQAELHKILPVLLNAGVNVILLKGVSLVRKIYPDIALRPMTDVDLMVHPGDIKKVTGLMIQSGYEVQKSTYHIVFWGGPAKNIIIEIHWNIMNSNLDKSSDESEWIWKDAFMHQDAYSLRLEKELLYLVGHMSIQHHTFPPRLIWLYDLFLYLEKYYSNLDWDFLVENANILGWRQELVAALKTSADYFPSQNLELAIERILVDFTQQQKKDLDRSWILRAMRGMSFDRGVRTAKGMFFPGFSYMQWRYHLSTRRFILIYYPKRWYELAKGVIRKK